MYRNISGLHSHWVGHHTYCQKVVSEKKGTVKLHIYYRKSCILSVPVVTEISKK